MPIFIKKFCLNLATISRRHHAFHRAKSFSLTETQLSSLVPWLEQSPKGHAMAVSARMSLRFGLNDSDTTSSYHASDSGRVLVGRWNGMDNTQEPNNVLIYQDGATEQGIIDCLASAADLKHECFVFGTPSEVFPMVKTFLESSGCVSEEDVFIQCSTKGVKAEDMQLSPDLRMRKMKADRADLVASKWFYKYPGASSVASVQLERGFGIEIVDQDENPVSWLLTMKNGETGMGFTIPEYRHQGLISVICYSLQRELQQSGMYISAYIKKPKEGSQMFFPSVTIQNQNPVRVVWAIKYLPSMK